MVVRGELGGRAEVFSGDRIPVRASVLPEEGRLDADGRGLKSGERLRLLVPADTRVQVGDGVAMDGRMYLVLSVARWSAHLELECRLCAG
jgi:hypothetical protein